MFANNTATAHIAHDIFVSNLFPCLKHDDDACNNVSLLYENTCIGIFHFTSSGKESLYATATYRISIQNRSIAAIPGIPISLGVTQLDQFGQNVSKLFPLSATISDSNEVKVNHKYAFITENTVIINGTPHKNATLILQSNIIVVVMVSLSIELQECPPGFSFNTSSSTCTCKTNSFISQCHTSTVSVKQGYWVGYMKKKSNQTVFAVGTCDYRLCQYKNETLFFGSYRLPSHPRDLNVCDEHRQGVLCGSCVEGYTVYYNSPTSKCGRSSPSLCKYGVVFYILSEIVPVTVLFLLIIIFNIHLTSGSLYSFIFFAQALDILYVDAYGAIKFEGILKAVLNAYKLFMAYRI